MILKYFFVFYLCLIFCAGSKAQTLPSDTGQALVINNYTKFYFEEINDNSRLYNGPEYFEYDPKIKGNAYYNDVNTWKLGTICYDDIIYNNVPMMYDVYKDCVVALYYNKVFSYILLNDKLNYFNLSGHHFVSVHVDSLSNPGIRNGIYDQLYRGKTEVLVKRPKTIQISTTGNLENYFSQEKKEIYLKKEGAYYNINSVSSILKTLQDKKKQVQLFISDNHIKYKTDPERALVKIASYYDQLAN